MSWVCVSVLSNICLSNVISIRKVCYDAYFKSMVALPWWLWDIWNCYTTYMERIFLSICFYTNKYVLYSMNVCSMNVLQVPCCHCHVTYSISCVASLPITASLLWPHRTVKLTMCAYVHFKTFRLLFYEFCEFGHTTRWAYCFLPTI